MISLTALDAVRAEAGLPRVQAKRFNCLAQSARENPPFVSDFPFNHSAFQQGIPGELP